MTITSLLGTALTPPVPPGVEVVASPNAAATEVLTSGALRFLAELHRRFEPVRRELLARRVERQRELDDGRLPEFLVDTRDIREREWAVAPAPADLCDRRVEITGPVDRKMIINGLNSGANVFMADFEDAHSPTWGNTMAGQVNLRDAVRGTIDYPVPNGKTYRLKGQVATLVVRPRGWHLVEKHFTVDGEPMSAALFDFGLFFFHNAIELLERHSAPYVYLPKLESHFEARLWNDVFHFAQDSVGLPTGTIRATVLIETILAAFEADEILWELREHSAGLNCGRWDYIFSCIKKLRSRPDVFPDRALLSMDRPFLTAYADHVIRTCHRRGAHAIGGMAAQIPIRSDPTANEQALAKVRADKLREVRAGHDGTWVAHPGLVGIASEAFGTLSTHHQIHMRRDERQVTARDLLEVPEGVITEAGLRTNVRVGIHYLESWLRGIGCVPIDHLMEDAATAEISRSQVWQWVKHGAVLTDGRRVTPELVHQTVEQEFERQVTAAGVSDWSERRFTLASKLLEDLMTSDELADFLTVAAYEYLD